MNINRRTSHLAESVLPGIALSAFVGVAIGDKGRGSDVTYREHPPSNPSEPIQANTAAGITDTANTSKPNKALLYAAAKIMV